MMENFRDFFAKNNFFENDGITLRRDAELLYADEAARIVTGCLVDETSWVAPDGSHPIGHKKTLAVSCVGNVEMETDPREDRSLMARLESILDEELYRLKRLPDDPPDMVCYGLGTEQCDVFVKLFPIACMAAMPFDDAGEVIDAIHHSLSDNQGLVEVGNGLFPDEDGCAYSIVKTALHPSGVQYCLTAHFGDGRSCVSVQGFFSEIGTTGGRDAAILERAIRSGEVNPQDWSGWAKDPYDANRTQGLLMNLSERQEYDAEFPEHPLSVARKLLGRIAKILYVD